MYASLPHRTFWHPCYGIPVFADQTARSSSCLCGLLHNTVRRVLIELPSRPYVPGGIGEFAGGATVELCLSSEVFDGMFRGELETTTAEMSGDLAFVGDVSVVMGLRSLQDDLNPPYLAVRGGA
jgi:hypothetical protein